MRLHQAVGLLARRLDVRPSRVKHIASRLQESGLISRVEGSRRFPTDIGEDEFVSLFLAVIAETGIGTATSTVQTFGALVDQSGHRLDDAMAMLFFGPTRSIKNLIARHTPPSVSIIADGYHTVFGDEAGEHAAHKASIVPGTTLTAIAAEAKGATPEHADAMAVISQLRG